jgi:hypothetical protein
VLATTRLSKGATLASFSFRARTRRVVAGFMLGVSILCLPACGGKECDRCESDQDCLQDPDAPFCVSFNNGSRRCGSGAGTTTCRVP